MIYVSQEGFCFRLQPGAFWVEFVWLHGFLWVLWLPLTAQKHNTLCLLVHYWFTGLSWLQEWAWACRIVCIISFHVALWVYCTTFHPMTIISFYACTRIKKDLTLTENVFFSINLFHKIGMIHWYPDRYTGTVLLFNHKLQAWFYTPCTSLFSQSLM